MSDITSLMIRFGIDASEISSGTAKVRSGIKGVEEQSASRVEAIAVLGCMNVVDLQRVDAEMELTAQLLSKLAAEAGQGLRVGA